MTVTVAPNWWYEIHDYSQPGLSLHQPGIAPDSAPDSLHDEEEMFPGGVSNLYITRRVSDGRDDHGLAVELVTLTALAALHEGLEWVRVDGEQLAEPHPVNESEMWEWLQRRVRRVVKDYIKTFPKEG